MDERLYRCLKEDDWGVLLVSIDNLDSFREAYGFVASDDVLRAISLMINHAVRELGTEDDMVGQFSPNEFIVVTGSRAILPMKNRIQNRLGQSLDYFYPVKDRGRELAKGERLTSSLYYLTAKQGPFSDLNQLKNRISTQRR